MKVLFTPEQEAQLAQLATKAGTGPEHLVKDAALCLLEDETAFDVTAPELPVLHLAMTFLHSSDIYDDILEPGIVDSNVLAFAANADVPHHVLATLSRPCCSLRRGGTETMASTVRHP